MDQHRDYDALLRHGSNGAPPPSHAMVPAPHHAAPHMVHPPQPHVMHPPPQYVHDPHTTHTIAQLQAELAHLRHQVSTPVHHAHLPPAPTLSRGHQNYSPHVPTGSDIREFPIGFTFRNIAAGASVDIEVKPQVKFKGHRLAVDPRLARYFTILDIKVGKDSQLAATGEMPASAFSALAVDTRMELDPAEPGIVLTLRVSNIDTTPRDFFAVLYGAVYERSEN
jgi:hypothetical protein